MLDLSLVHGMNTDIDLNKAKKGRLKEIINFSITDDLSLQKIKGYAPFFNYTFPDDVVVYKIQRYEEMLTSEVSWWAFTNNGIYKWNGVDSFERVFQDDVSELDKNMSSIQYQNKIFVADKKNNPFYILPKGARYLEGTNGYVPVYYSFDIENGYLNLYTQPNEEGILIDRFHFGLPKRDRLTQEYIIENFYANTNGDITWLIGVVDIGVAKSISNPKWTLYLFTQYSENIFSLEFNAPLTFHYDGTSHSTNIDFYGGYPDNTRDTLLLYNDNLIWIKNDPDNARTVVNSFKYDVNIIGISFKEIGVYTWGTNKNYNFPIHFNYFENNNRFVLVFNRHHIFMQFMDWSSHYRIDYFIVNVNDNTIGFGSDKLVSSFKYASLYQDWNTAPKQDLVSAQYPFGNDYWKAGVFDEDTIYRWLHRVDVPSGVKVSNNTGITFRLHGELVPQQWDTENSTPVTMAYNSDHWKELSYVYPQIKPPAQRNSSASLKFKLLNFSNEKGDIFNLSQDYAYGNKLQGDSHLFTYGFRHNHIHAFLPIYNITSDINIQSKLNNIYVDENGVKHGVFYFFELDILFWFLGASGWATISFRKTWLSEYAYIVSANSLNLKRAIVDGQDIKIENVAVIDSTDAIAYPEVTYHYEYTHLKSKSDRITAVTGAKYNWLHSYLDNPFSYILQNATVKQNMLNAINSAYQNEVTALQTKLIGYYGDNPSYFNSVSYFNDIYRMYFRQPVFDEDKIFFINSPALFNAILTSDVSSININALHIKATYIINVGETLYTSLGSKALTVTNQGIRLMFLPVFPVKPYEIYYLKIYFFEVVNGEDELIGTDLIDLSTPEKIEQFNTNPQKLYLEIPPISEYYRGKSIFNNPYIMTKHLDRLILSGDGKYPDYLNYSEVYYPEQFPAQNGRPIEYNDNDNIVGIASLYDRLYIFKNNATYVIVGDVEEGLFMKLSDKLGSISKNSIQVINRYIYFLSNYGLCVLMGNDIRNISEGIINKFIYSFTKEELQNSFAVYYGTKNEYRLYIKDKVLVYNIKHKTFTVEDKIRGEEYTTALQINRDEKQDYIIFTDTRGIIFKDDEGRLFYDQERDCKIRTQKIRTGEFGDVTQIYSLDFVLGAKDDLVVRVSGQPKSVPVNRETFKVRAMSKPNDSIDAEVLNKSDRDLEIKVLGIEYE